MIGAQSSVGGAIRAALEALGIPGDRVDLFGTSTGEALIGEYAGEARLIQPPEAEEVRGHAAAFLCELESASERVLGPAADEGLVLDLTDSEWGRRRGGLAGTGSDATSDATGTGVVRIPHALSTVLADLLRPVAAGPGLRDATAVVLRPASDFGEPGVEELRSQTVHLLNFAEAPRTVFGRQLAFNVLPSGAVGDGRDDLENRVRRETSALLGSASPRISTRLLLVPVFLGHGIALRIRTETTPTTTGDLAEMLRGVEGVRLEAASGPRTPLETEERSGIVVSQIDPDGVDGHWIWVTVADAGAIWARSAVRWAAKLLKLHA